MVATLPVTGPLQRQGSLTATALLSRPVPPDGWACSFGHVWLKGDLVSGKDRFPSEQRLTIGEDGSNPQAAFGSR